MTCNHSKNIVPKIMIVLFAFVLMSSIPVASAQFAVGGGSSGGSGGGGDRSAPTFTDDSLSINQNIIIEDTTFNTVSVQTADSVEFIVMASDDRGAQNITHLDIFLNHDGNQVLNNLKETHVTFSSDDLFIQNPDNIIESATMDTALVDDDMKFTFNVVFAASFDTSDILVRTWDVSGNSSSLYFPDSLKVIESSAESTVDSPTESIPIDTSDDAPLGTPVDTSDDAPLGTPVDTSDDATSEVEMVDISLSQSVALEGENVLIPYDISGGMVTSATINTDDNSIIINIDAPDDGTLTVTPSQSTQDGIFMVLVDGEEWDDAEINGNKVTVEFPAGAKEIEIIGTFVIPEFGTITMMILLVSIVSVIAITAKSRLVSRI